MLFTKAGIIKSYSQNRQIIMGYISDTLLYNDTINFTITTLMCPLACMEKELDIDNDSINDLKFSICEIISGWYGLERSIEIEPLDSTFIVRILYPDSHNELQTYLPRQFEYGDTLNVNMEFSNLSTYIYYIRDQSYSAPPPTFIEYDYWKGDKNKYLGYKKIKKGEEYLGWIKLSVEYYELTIHDLAIVKEIIPVDTSTFPNDTTSIQNGLLYPNPTNATLYLPNMNVLSYQIYSLSGQLIEAKETAINQSIYPYEINVSRIPNGTYLLLLETHEGRKTYKFVKD